MTYNRKPHHIRAQGAGGSGSGIEELTKRDLFLFRMFGFFRAISGPRVPWCAYLLFALFALQICRAFVCVYERCIFASCMYDLRMIRGCAVFVLSSSREQLDAVGACQRARYADDICASSSGMGSQNSCLFLAGATIIQSI